MTPFALSHGKECCRYERRRPPHRSARAQETRPPGVPGVGRLHTARAHCALESTPPRVTLSQFLEREPHRLCESRRSSTIPPSSCAIALVDLNRRPDLVHMDWRKKNFWGLTAQLSTNYPTALPPPVRVYASTVTECGACWRQPRELYRTNCQSTKPPNHHRVGRLEHASN